MAASDADHDYYHIVLKALESQYGKATGNAFNFSTWEVQAHDRSETFELVEPYLSQKLDIITVQLWENVSDTTTYEDDLVSLLLFLKEKAPHARILVIGDIWSGGNAEPFKANAVKRTGVEFVSLDGITDNPDYSCGLGATVYDDEGNPHTVEHEGVAAHPGDKGMRAIAERILSVLG